MPHSRILAAYLTLAALLFGNVAGWVHVGCPNHSSGCCSISLADSQASDMSNPTAGDHGGRCSCHHECGIEIQADLPEPPPLDSQEPVGQHDSDSCSVCQSFFASRHAVAFVEPVFVIERIAVSRNIVAVDDVFVAEHHASSQTVRGPPSV